MSSGNVLARRGWSVAAVTAVLFAGFLNWMPSASAAEEDPRFPGLPTIDGNYMPGTVQTAVVSGVQEVSAAKQWFRLPRILSGIDYHVALEADPDDPGNYLFFNNFLVYLIDLEGPPYGYAPPVQVQSVAFGAIPVKYSIHIEQLRDENDLPLPWTATMQQYFAPPVGNDGATINGLANLRVSDVKVDGVTVDVGGSCRAKNPAEINLHGIGYRGDEWPDRNDAWKVTDRYGIPGGLLTGTVDVPGFEGCISPTERISVHCSLRWDLVRVTAPRSGRRTHLSRPAGGR